jgi:hypothetical protein
MAVAADPVRRALAPPPELPGDGLAERLRNYFDWNADVSREEFLYAAVRGELDRRGWRFHAGRPWPSRARGGHRRRPVRQNGAREHAWLIGRLAVLRKCRATRWQRLVRFLFGRRRWR